MKLNLFGKVLFTAIAAAIVGRPVNIKLRGTADELNAIVRIINASRAFNDELVRPGATVETLSQLLGTKHAAAREFERILGVSWPL